MTNYQNLNYYTTLSYYIKQIEMLLVDRKHVKFTGAKYQKILHLSTAINGSICFLGIKGHRQDCLTHIDANGKVIK